MTGVQLATDRLALSLRPSFIIEAEMLIEP